MMSWSLCKQPAVPPTAISEQSNFSLRFLAPQAQRSAFARCGSPALHGLGGLGFLTLKTAPYRLHADIGIQCVCRYESDDTPMVCYLNVHETLEQRRRAAKEAGTSGRSGPRTIVSPSHSLRQTAEPLV